jgi:hypothetical protein
MAVERNLENPIYIGEDVLIHETVYQTNQTTIQDVTGYTFTFIISKADAAVLTLTPAIVVAASGTVDVTITAAQTTALANTGQYEYHFKRTNAGYVTILGHGYLELRA